MAGKRKTKGKMAVKSTVDEHEKMGGGGKRSPGENLGAKKGGAMVTPQNLKAARRQGKRTLKPEEGNQKRRRGIQNLSPERRETNFLALDFARANRNG